MRRGDYNSVKFNFEILFLLIIGLAKCMNRTRLCCSITPYKSALLRWDTLLISYDRL